MTNQQLNVGAILTNHLETKRIRRAALARKMGILLQSLLSYQKKTSLQTDKLWELSHALEHNFFADIASQLPTSYTTTINAHAENQQKIADNEDEGTFFQSDNESELPPLDLYLEQKRGASRFSDKYLQTGLIPAKLDKALLKLETEAHTMLQEQGVEVLYLALGFLQWNEPTNSSVSRYAPLILVPVELIRSSARDSFKLRYTGEDLGSNLRKQRMQAD